MLNFIDIPQAKGSLGPGKKMLIMHGRGDVKESFIPFVKEVNVTGLGYRLVDAPTPFFFGHSWYPMPPEDPIAEIKRSCELIHECIQTMECPSEEIFLAGFSQGGAMAIEMALTSGLNFAGIVALSPRIFLRDELIEKAKNSNLDYFIAHGKFDDVIPFEETNSRVKELQKCGLKIEFHPFDCAHEIDVLEILALRNWLNERL